jgi:hypothetical protein
LENNDLTRLMQDASAIVFLAAIFGLNTLKGTAYARSSVVSGRKGVALAEPS